MTIRISEAMRLFQLEHRLEKEPITDELVGQIPDVTTLKVVELVPEIPLEWRDSEAFLSSVDRIFDRLFFEEVQFDHAMRALISSALAKLKSIVEKDLAFRVFQLSQSFPREYRNFIRAQSADMAYKILSKVFPDFQPSKQNVQTREEQEICSVRMTTLSMEINKQSLESYKEKGREISPDQDKLEDLVRNILDFLLKLGQAEYIRSYCFQKESEEMFRAFEEQRRRANEKVFQPNILVELQPGQLETLGTRKGISIEIDPSAIVSSDPDIARTQHELKTIGKKISLKNAKFLNTVCKGMNNIKPLGNIIMANLIEKAAGISGLATNIFPFALSFFQGGIDVSSRRYKSLIRGMKALAKGQQVILDNISILHKQLGEIDRKIVVLAGNQAKLAEGIVQVMHLVELQHQQVIRALASITHEVVLSRLAISSILAQAGMMCREARRRLMSFSGYRPYYNRFISYSALQVFYRREKLSLVEGLQGLRKLIMDPGDNDAPLIVGNQESTKERLFFEHYEGLWRMFCEEYRDGSLKGFEFFLMTCTNVDHLNRYLEKYRNKAEPVLTEWMQERLMGCSIHKLVQIPYDIDRLLDYCESARCFHYFYELFEDVPGGALVAYDHLEAHEPGSWGERLLQDAFIRIEIGIFQLNLLSGNGILPLIDQKIKGSNKEERERVYHLLATNRILARNYMVYSFRKRIEEKKHPYTDYYFPYSSVENSGSLQKLLGDDWNFIWDGEKKEWGVCFMEHVEPIPLPEPTLLINGTFELHPHLGNLHLMRKKILRELAGYQSKESQGKIGKLYLSGIILNSIFFRTIMNEQQKDKNDNKNRRTIQARL